LRGGAPLFKELRILKSDSLTGGLERSDTKKEGLPKQAFEL
jgi:hypothetical protein